MLIWPLIIGCCYGIAFGLFHLWLETQDVFDGPLSFVTQSARWATVCYRLEMPIYLLPLALMVISVVMFPDTDWPVRLAAAFVAHGVSAGALLMFTRRLSSLSRPMRTLVSWALHR